MRTLPAELRRLLDAVPLPLIVEYVAERVGEAPLPPPAGHAAGADEQRPDPAPAETGERL